jgi:hypothetical protein
MPSCADKRFLALPTSSEDFYIWEAVSRQGQQIPLGPQMGQSELTTASWSGDGSLIALCTCKGAIILFDIMKRTVTFNLQGIHEKVPYQQTCACSYCASAVIFSTTATIHPGPA